MLKIEAIKSTWETLSKDEQLSLLNELKLLTLGLCRDSVYGINPSKHLVDIFGCLSYSEYKIMLQKYYELMKSVVSGVALIYFEGERIELSTIVQGIFEIRYSENNLGFENRIVSKENFLNLCYSEHAACIYVDDKVLSSFFNKFQNKNNMLGKWMSFSN